MFIISRATDGMRVARSHKVFHVLLLAWLEFASEMLAPRGDLKFETKLYIFTILVTKVIVLLLLFLVCRQFFQNLLSQLL